MGIESQNIQRQYVYQGETPPSSPFQGQIWYDTSNQSTKQYKNQEWVEITADLAPIWESILEIEVDIVELNYLHSMNAESRDLLFVDPFVDESKILSTNHIQKSIGQNGNIIIEERNSSHSANFSYANLYDQENDWYNYETIEMEVKEESSIVSTVECNVQTPDGWGGQSGQFNVTVKKNGTQVASGSVIHENSPGGTQKAVNFSKSDYSELLNPGDTITIDVNITTEGAGLDPLETENPDYDSETFTVLSNRVVGDLGVTVRGNFSTATLTSIEIDKGFTPSGVQLDADKETDSETSVSGRIYDGTGNEIIVNESELGEEIMGSFSDSSVQVDLELSTENRSKTPVVNDYALRLLR